MEYSNNEPDGGFSGKSYELNLYLLFLHRGCRNNSYGFKLHREQKDAGKFDDLVFEFQENGATVYRLLQAKHSMSPGKRIREQMLFSGGDGAFDLIKYLVSYRTAKQNYSAKGQIKDFVICTSRSFDFKQLKIDIEKVVDVDNILDLGNDDKRSVKCRLKNTKQNFGKIKGEWKKRMNKWEKENDVRKAQPEPDEREIADYLNRLTFAVDMPNDTDLGVILKNEIGEEFNEMARKDIYNRAFQRMIDWMKANDRRNFWTHEDAKAMFEDIKAGFTLPCNIRYNVQPSVSLFTGRKEHLEAVHKLLQEQKRVMISGLGGVGKTELVRKYIEIHSEKYYNNILWINAESDTALENSFRSLASDKLGIKTKNANDEEKDIKVVIGEVYQWFQQSKSLFIFENAEWEQYPTHIRPSLPKNVNEPFIIVTSRRKWKNESIIKTVELSVFTESEAFDFVSNSLSKFLNNDQQTDSVKKLAETLQYLPLALTQATAYISAEYEYEPDSNQISEYIENFSRKSMEYLDYDFSDYCESGYTKTVWTTWDITIEALKRKEAYTLNVLNCVSFLLPDNIHTELLSKFLKEDENLKYVVRLLNEYSLITARKKVHSVHRLVQLVTREKLERDKKREVLEKIFGSLVENDEIVTRNIDHFTSAWMHLKADCIEFVQKHYQIPATIAFILFNAERHRDAYSLGVEALELMKSLSLNNEKEQNFVQNIAPIIVKHLCNSGKHEEALDKSKQILTILQNVHEQFPYTVPILSIKNDIVVTCLHREDVNAAMDFYNEPVLRNETAPGKYTKIIDFRREIKADMYTKFAGYDGALTVYRELLDTKKSNDPGALRICKKIANVFYEVHVHEKAVKFNFEIEKRSDLANKVLLILQKEYKEQKKLLPNNHSDRLETQESIISLLIEQEKYKEALTLLKDITDERLAGNNCKLLARKAAVLALLKKNDDALAICDDLKEDALMIERSDFKIQSFLSKEAKNYAEVVDRYVRISLIMSLLGKFDEALMILKEIWYRLKHSISYYNFHIANILEIIGHIYLMQNKRVEGLNAFEEAWQCYTYISLIYHLKSQTSVIFLQKFHEEGQLHRALLHGLKLLDVYEKLSENRLQEMRIVKRKIAQIYHDKKEYDEALNILKEMKESQELLSKEDDYEYVQTCVSIISIERDKKLYEDDMLKTIKDPFEAVKRGNLEQLKKLIKGGVDVNATDVNEWTLLHHAASTGKQEILEYLLQNGADMIRATEKSGNTVLHIAVTRNHFTFVVLLVEFDFDKSKTIINTKTKESGTTALHIAAKKGLLEMVRFLLIKGAVYNVKNNAGKSPIDMAKDVVIETVLREVEMGFRFLESRDLEQFKNYLQFQHFTVYGARNVEGYSLLQLAVMKNSKELVELILAVKPASTIINLTLTTDYVEFDECISNILCNNKISEYSKWIRNLVKMSRDWNEDFLKFLFCTVEDMLDLLDGNEHWSEIAKLAKLVVDEQMKKFMNLWFGALLLEAIKLGDVKKFEYCLEKLNDTLLDLIDDEGMTPLHHAVAKGNKTMVKLLLDRNVKIHCASQTGITPLHRAAENNHVDVTKLLLERDSSYVFVNERTQGGSTALHLAAKKNHLEMVKLLLEHHANYGLVDNDGNAPADLAEERDMRNLFKFVDELHNDANESRILEKLERIEPAERRPLLNAINKEGKKLRQIVAGRCKDKKKVLSLIGDLPETDSQMQADLTRMLLDFMLTTSDRYESIFC